MGQNIVYRWIDGHALACAALLVGGFALAAYLAHGYVLAQSKAPEGASETIRIGDRRLAMHPDWVMGTTTHGDKERISLRMPLASLAPEALADADSAVALVFTTSDESIAPSERVKMLYARFLSSEATPAAGGLIRRQFKAGTPYEGETLFLSPPEGRAFAARCPTDESVGQALSCFAEIRHAGYDIQIQVARRDLASWEKITARLKDLLGRADG
ncbi:MAG TPA: hypothetical protein VLQ65_05535 [Saliniramus sp.]|nr:hypothetical protein [Saliniramus sp.]